jgi:heterodisulfide reductase subunit A-like polyferredoxin
MWLPVVFFCAAGSCQFWSDDAYTSKQECLQRVSEITQIIESHPETTVAGHMFPCKAKAYK